MLEKLKALQDLKNRLKKLRSNADEYASIGLTIAICETITMQDELINTASDSEKIEAINIIK
jgi:hypothetical protein